MTEHWKRKRRCPKCGRHKIPNQFKRDDKKGWCRSCRNFRAPKGSSPASYDQVADAMVVSRDVELELGDSRVVVVQRLGDAVRITTARREKRTITPSLMIGGNVLLPIEHLPAIFKAMRKATRKVM